jgi:hypothetical protein
MSLERVDSVDPAEIYDYIICGYVSSLEKPRSMKSTHTCLVVAHQDV